MEKIQIGIIAGILALVGGLALCYSLGISKDNRFYFCSGLFLVIETIAILCGN